MTNNELAAHARQLKLRNARNKRRIMEHRRQLAITKAKNEGIAHPGKFMTNYKYG